MVIVESLRLCGLGGLPGPRPETPIGSALLAVGVHRLGALKDWHLP